MDERRRFSRMNRDRTACTLSFGGASFSGFVSEESIGGVRVSGLDLLCLPDNQPVELEYHGSVEQGVCRNLTRGLEDDLELGIMLKTKSVIAEPRGLLLSCYFSVQDYWVVCRPVSVDEKHRLTICLFDGKEFQVDRQAVVPFTREERTSELHENPQRTTLLADLYGMGTSSLDAMIKEVIEFEFCIPQMVTI